MTHIPMVYVAILDYNRLPDTLECLESVRSLAYASFRVFCVDNGSRTPCLPAISRRYPSVTVIRSEVNLGFARGCNLVIRKALEDGADYVWLLNNDTVVDAKALSALVDEAEKDSRCGIAGSKIYYEDRRDTLHHAGGGFDPSTGRFCHFGFDDVDGGAYDRAVEVYFVSGCSLLARTAMVRDVGLLDEVYGSYFEDTDWCVRARRAGWGVRYTPGSVVYHKVSRTTNRGWFPRYVYYYSRNYLIFFWKNYPGLFPRALCRWWVRDFVWKAVRNGDLPGLAAGVLGMLDMARVIAVRLFAGAPRA